MHDKFAIHPFYFKGWEIDFGNGTTVPESSVQINSGGNQKKVSQDWTKAYITLNHSYKKIHNVNMPYPPCSNDDSIIGMVDMKSYRAWLKSIGVDITSSDPSPTQQMCH